mmetsp:Transcript_4766/g.19026  ORF Transcript_4766/g.19026 Transcript_4766/m.19026 type:complete len:270 (+) Transcript_4766:1422-2231(+)
MRDRRRHAAGGGDQRHGRVGEKCGHARGQGRRHGVVFLLMWKIIETVVTPAPMPPVPSYRSPLLPGHRVAKELHERLVDAAGQVAQLVLRQSLARLVGEDVGRIKHLVGVPGGGHGFAVLARYRPVSLRICAVYLHLDVPLVWLELLGSERHVLISPAQLRCDLVRVQQKVFMPDKDNGEIDRVIQVCVGAVPIIPQVDGVLVIEAKEAAASLPLQRFPPRKHSATPVEGVVGLAGLVLFSVKNPSQRVAVYAVSTDARVAQHEAGIVG